MAQRERPDLTRYRSTFIRERLTMVNRVQKRLEDANINLPAADTDIMGVSGRAMLAALVAGATDPQALADLAKGRLRDKREQLIKTLEGRVKPPHRFVLTALLCQIDGWDETMAHFDARIQEISGPFKEAVALLDTIPGGARDAAEMIVAEIGTNMSRFRSTADLASWAGVAPGNHKSAGQRASGKTRQGNRPLRTVLTQMVHAAARTRDTYLAAQCRRLATRRGKKKAIVAVAHSIVVMAYYMLLHKEPYREAGADYFDKYRPDVTAKRLLKRLEALGYRAADQEQDRRQTCLPEGLSAASACCEALRAEQQVDDNPQRVVEGAKRPRQHVVIQQLPVGTPV